MNGFLKTLAKPDWDDNPKRSEILNAANLLQIGEFQLVQLAYKVWYGKDLPEDKIDKINILEATYLAMKCAIGELRERPDIILIDGPRSNIKHYKVDHIINGDSLSKSIAAASIIAKVERDNEMIALDKIYPGYGFSSHKGYPTKQHLESLEKLGITDIHRCTFSPVSKYI